MPHSTARPGRSAIRLSFRLFRSRSAPGDRGQTIMQPLRSYLQGRWIDGDGQPAVLVNPSTEEPLAEIRPVARLGDAVAFARDRGGPALRALSFAERGELLLALSKLIHQSRDELIELALQN